MGRARVPARREQVFPADLAQRLIGSILDFGNHGSRGRDPSPAPALHGFPKIKR